MKLFPEGIKKIAFVALAGPADPDKIKRGKEFLEKEGYEVAIGKSVNSCSSIRYLSSDTRTRVNDLHSFWADRSIDLIIAARGGYGSSHILGETDWSLLSSRKVPFIGYSDMTAMHLAMCAKGAGIAISGPMAHNFCDLGNDLFTLQSLRSVFSREQEIRSLPGRRFHSIRAGKAKGLLFPVTLSVFVSLIGTQYMPRTKGAILLVEDINEDVYKLDRYFTQLEHSGILSGLSGLLLGSFKKCGNSKERKVLFERVAEKVNGPVVMNVPFGHVYPRISVAFMSVCEIDASGKSSKMTINNSWKGL